MNRIVAVAYLVADWKNIEGTNMFTTRVAIHNSARQNDPTVFINILAFNRTGKLAMRYTKKGSRILIDGRLTVNEWETKDGQKRSEYRIVCEKIEFLDKPSANGNTANTNKENDIPF